MSSSVRECPDAGRTWQMASVLWNRAGPRRRGSLRVEANASPSTRRRLDSGRSWDEAERSQRVARCAHRHTRRPVRDRRLLLATRRGVSVPGLTLGQRHAERSGPRPSKVEKVSPCSVLLLRPSLGREVGHQPELGLQGWGQSLVHAVGADLHCDLHWRGRHERKGPACATKLAGVRRKRRARRSRGQRGPARPGEHRPH